MVEPSIEDDVIEYIDRSLNDDDTTKLNLNKEVGTPLTYENPFNDLLSC